jgi:K+-sensing histidine kinase KdpD
LLKAAKLSPDQVDLNTDDVSIQELIWSVIANQPKAGGGNTVHVVLDEPGMTVRADRGLLEIVLRQYVDNAQKYSTPGSPIEISARMSYSEVLISVHNIGPTIRMEDRERIFERFYRSADLKDAVPGTGVGLSVVKKAAEAHRGHVWVVSDERLGTTFYLSLPNKAKGAR